MLKTLALAFGLLACALSVCQANAPQGFIRAQVTLNLPSSRKLIPGDYLYAAIFVFIRWRLF